MECKKCGNVLTAMKQTGDNKVFVCQKCGTLTKIKKKKNLIDRILRR